MSLRTKPDIPAAPRTLACIVLHFPLSRGSSTTSMTVAQDPCAGLHSLHPIAGVSARDAA